MTGGCHLGGAGVLVTRPEHQAGEWCRLIEAHGGRALRLPALAIAGPADPGPARQRLARLDDCRLMIFVSPNAVRQGLALLPDAGLPPGLQVAAVGDATAAALAAAGRPADLVPETSQDSEGLLALPRLQAVADETVLIVRGEGGRPLLGDTLTRRGARVEYLEVYRRVCPETDVGPLLAQWDRVDLVTATSNQILDNLLRLFGEAGRGTLQATPLLVISRRTEDRARSLGWARVWRAAGVSERAILGALCKHLGKGPGESLNAS